MERTRNDIRIRYDLYARYYDLDDTIFLGTKQRLRARVVELAGIREGTSVLDVMVGTGKLSVLAAEAGGEVVGVDLSRPMLALAKQRADDLGVDGITLKEGDAEDLPFEDGSFDTVISSYGLDTVFDPEKAVREMMRVVKKGGRIAAAYKSFPTGIFSSLIDKAVSAYLGEFWYCRNVDVKRIMKKAGLKGIREESYWGGMGKVCSATKK